MREEKNFSALIRGLIAGIGFGLICMLCFYMGTRFSYARQSETSVLDDPLTVEKIQYLEKLISQYYLYEPNGSDLAEGLYAGLLYGLGDPYSQYFTAKQYQEEHEYDEGAYKGLGVTFGKLDDGRGLVSTVYPGSPAEEAGILPGDEILEVNGEDIAPLTSDEVVEMIRGGESEEVTLLLYRPSEDRTFEVSTGIREVELTTVYPEMLKDDVGYMQITQFSNVTPKQFEEGMKSLREQGMTKLIIDLRGNPGGMLNAACDCLRQILPEGLIVYMEDKYGVQETLSCDGKNAIDIPLAVLINGNSASAAEIFAGAVQDHRVGTIVGTTSYGKGVVQGFISLVDGSAIKLTTSQYFTPKGNVIEKQGVTPDLILELDYNDYSFPDNDNQLAMALYSVGAGEKPEVTSVALKEEAMEGSTETETETETREPVTREKKKEKGTLRKKQ